MSRSSRLLPLLLLPFASCDEPACVDTSLPDPIPDGQARESHMAACAPGSALNTPIYPGQTLKGVFWCYGDPAEGLIECFQPNEGAATTYDDNGTPTLKIECPPEGDVMTWARTDWG